MGLGTSYSSVLIPAAAARRAEEQQKASEGERASAKEGQSPLTQAAEATLSQRRGSSAFKTPAHMPGSSREVVPETEEPAGEQTANLSRPTRPFHTASCKE